MRLTVDRDLDARARRRARQLATERLTLAGATVAEYAYTDTGDTGHGDYDRDGTFEWQATLTLSGQTSMLLIETIDPATGRVTRSERRNSDGTTVNVHIEENGQPVDEFDAPVDQNDGASPRREAAPPPSHPCPVDTFFEYDRYLDDCISDAAGCLLANDRDDIAAQLYGARMKVFFTCGDLGGADATSPDATDGPLARHPHIIINDGAMSGKDQQYRRSTICHELMHHTQLGLHDGAIPDDFVGDADPVYGCQALCLPPVAGFTPTQCQCASCLHTTICDKRYSKHRTCPQPQMGAICPCKQRHIWYPTLTECLEKCPSGLACFGYLWCKSLDRSCPSGQ
jgi:hypothetical protein